MMKHVPWITALALVAIVAWFASAADPLQKPAAGPAPLQVDKSAPLLLDDAPSKEAANDSKKPHADNSACFVCHGNFQEEKLVTIHSRQNIGCAKCHGASLAHRNDEDNITPPDKMYSHRRIDDACRQCHEEHTASPRKVIAMFQERFPKGADPQMVACTDCHGEHRLKVRSVLWDKDSGKLLKSDHAEKSGVGRKKAE